MLHEPSAVLSLTALIPGAVTLPDDLLAHVQGQLTPHDVAQGEILLRQRAVTFELVVLVSGTIATLVEFAGVGDLVVETTDQPGRIFGWSGLRPPGRATATVRTDSACLVLTMPLDTLARVAGPESWLTGTVMISCGARSRAAMARTHADGTTRSTRPIPSRVGQRIAGANSAASK